MSVNGRYALLPNSQFGVSLLEVLIALLLLGIAALGYAALQGQALQSTDESLSRTQAVNLLADTAEAIRVNALGATYILKMSPTSSGSIPTSNDILTEYSTKLNSTTIPNEIACNENIGCTPSETASNDVRAAKLEAQKYDMKIGTSVCPGTEGVNKGKTMCLIAAWGNTEAKMGSTGNYCMTTTGAYRIDADCVYMEAY